MSNKKYTIEFCKQLAIGHKGKCLSEGYISSDANLLWECEFGHQWYATLSNVKHNETWCPKCSGKEKLAGLDIAHKIAETHHGKCLSEEYKNSTPQKLLWECEFGHQWEACLSYVWHNNCWCPHCKKLDGIKIATKIAESWNGKCLSTEYKNVKDKLLWECQYGHQWKISLSETFKKKSWCPHCKKIENFKIAQEIAISRKGKCLSTEYRNSAQKLLWECEFDHQWYASLNSVKDNKSWCMECSGKNKLDGLTIAQKIAESKKGKCLSIEYINSTIQKLLWECEFGHQWYASLNAVKDNHHWCLDCSGSKKYTIETAKKEALKHNGKCLSDEYLSTDSNLIWQCDKGHIWEAPLKSVKARNSWCKQCYKPSITIEKLKKIAMEKGGECLSDDYVPESKLLWKCKLGHEWEATARGINLGRAWCPVCGRLKASKTMNTAHILYHWKTGEELVCVGSYEVKTVEYFNKNCIDFLWQSKTFRISEKRTYRPDAYLITRDKWIEIKGYFRQYSRDKWDWFHENYPNSELWDRLKLESMKILESKK